MKQPDSVSLYFPDGSGFEKTDIIFHNGTPDLPACFQEGECRLFVTDTTVAALPCMKDFISSFDGDVRTGSNDVLLVLGAGEAHKTIESVLAIVRAALEHNFTRSSVFIGIGGGVICDMTGFAASMFKRGVAAEFVPTTLLADVDASIGGKTGCDFESYKNMIGAFYPARAVHIWSDFVQTLPQDEYRSGLAEAIKTAFLFSPELCTLFAEQKDAVLKRDKALLAQIIQSCAAAKAAVVHRDFKEKGERAFLNLGHTFGHALESVAGLGEVTHGDGVAWGMGRAFDLAARLGLCQTGFATGCKDLLASYGYDMSPIPHALAQRADAAEVLLSAMRKDKKNLNTKNIRIIMQTGNCQTISREVADADILAVLR